MALSIHDAPAPFNPDYRPGISEALSAAHGEWCEANPDVTQEERRQAFKETQDRLRPNFPSIREMQEKSQKLA